MIVAVRPVKKNSDKVENGKDSSEYCAYKEKQSEFFIALIGNVIANTAGIEQRK